MFRQVGSPIPTWGWYSVPFPAHRIWKRACEAPKRAKNGLLWFLPFFENYLPSRKVSRLITIWKGNSHAKFWLPDFKDGREKVTEDPVFYLPKSLFESSRRPERAPEGALAHMMNSWKWSDGCVWPRWHDRGPTGGYIHPIPEKKCVQTQEKRRNCCLERGETTLVFFLLFLYTFFFRNRKKNVSINRRKKTSVVSPLSRQQLCRFSCF